MNVESSNLVFLKTDNTEFDKIIIKFADQNGRPLEMKIKLIWHCLLINRNDTLFEVSNATIIYRTKNKKTC